MSIPNKDVRMRGFAERAPASAAVAWVDENSAVIESEQIDTVNASGRVLAVDIQSTVNVPSYHRSMMDGFAVLADDTSGAGAYNQLTLKVVGESLPASPWSGTLAAGQAVRIMTGAPVPDLSLIHI